MRKGKGFGALKPEERAEISRKGGKAVHAAGTGYEWNSEAAAEAGRKGGLESARRRKAAKS